MGECRKISGSALVWDRATFSHFSLCIASQRKSWLFEFMPSLFVQLLSNDLCAIRPLSLFEFGFIIILCHGTP